MFEDIKETSDFYNSRQKDLGNEFVAIVKSEFKKLLKNPLLFEIKNINTRVAFIARFPFGIQENTNRIVVKGVFHMARNSEVWYER